MRFPIRIGRPAFILLAAAIGGIAFAACGLALGFYSVGHWIAGGALLAFIAYILPRFFIVE